MLIEKEKIELIERLFKRRIELKKSNINPEPISAISILEHLDKNATDFKEIGIDVEIIDTMDTSKILNTYPFLKGSRIAEKQSGYSTLPGAETTSFEQKKPRTFSEVNKLDSQQQNKQEDAS